MSESLGARLERFRKARGLTRDALSDACAALGQSIEPGAIWSYERGLFEPRIRNFAALARALGVSMEELLHGDGREACVG